MRIKVIQLDRDWREVRIRLPLNAISRNPGGVMFGGYQAIGIDLENRVYTGASESRKDGQAAGY